MCFIKNVWGTLKKFPTILQNWFFYLLIFAVPLLYFPLLVDGRSINLRKIREIGFYSFAVIICSFLQKNKWLRLFIIWCVINWWANFFFPEISYVGLTNIFSALVIYIGLKHLLDKRVLNVDVVLKVICIAVLFQGLWLVFQIFDYDPLENVKYSPKFYATTTTGAPRGGTFARARAPLVSWSGNPSILGVFFASTSFLLLHYFRIRKIPILFFVILSSVFLLKNATTAICFTGAGIFYLLSRYRFKIRYILAGFLIIASLATFFVYVKQPNFDRIPVWKQLIENLTIRPYVGTGINTFMHLFVIDKTGTPWKEAHNDYLQILFELGWIGFILFMGFIISKFVEFFRSKKTNKQICIASCLVAYLIAGISLFPMHLAQLSFYAVVLLATLESTYNVNT